MRAVHKEMGLMKYGEQSEMLQNWLNVNAPGYKILNQEEKDAIMYFSFLWSLFEAQVLDTWASAKSIEKKSILWHELGRLKAEEFEQFKKYFVQRYIDNDETNYRFEQLRLPADKKNLVQSVLEGEEKNIASVVTSMLFIVLRYRNNFFHGNKWDYGFNDQLDNFNTANKLLMKVIEINNH